MNKELLTSEKTLCVYGWEQKGFDEWKATLPEFRCHEKTYGIYLHGDIERLAGYDLFKIINANDFEWEVVPTEYTDKNNKPYIENVRYFSDTGIFNCKVHGIDEECTAFIWAINNSFYGNRHGLIVMNSDKSSYEHALKKYQKQDSDI